MNRELKKWNGPQSISFIPLDQHIELVTRTLGYCNKVDYC